MNPATHDRVELERVTILFSGDSGDGMQLTGTQFTTASAMLGNDVSTLPDYPSEIRAPAGSLAGVSAFQLSFSSRKIQTPGDRPSVLMAMNPAALKVYLPQLEPGGVMVVNSDAFTKGNLRKAGYDGEPARRPGAGPPCRPALRSDHDGDPGRPGERRSQRSPEATLRCKNFFALGLLYWLYDRPIEPTLEWIGEEVRPRAAGRRSQPSRALDAGQRHRGPQRRLRRAVSGRPAAPTQPGDYRMISGNEAFALGAVTAARLADKPLVLQQLSDHPGDRRAAPPRPRSSSLDVRTIQAEDEIAAMGSAIGAAYGGAFSLTGTSGPGVCLKSEAINLAIMLELPVVILNVQRGGPSTGLPTKTEQSDLLQAMSGRNGESPIPILAASSAADCFDVAIEAFRIAVRHTTPVFVLSETYVANGAEPWPIPKFEEFARIPVEHPVEADGFHPYARDEETLARPWAVPGTPSLEHRLGGLEKQDGTGNVSHDPENHERMSRLRAEKVQRIAELAPEQGVDGPDEGDMLVVSWGGTRGAVSSAVRNCRDRGHSVAHAHLRYLNPFPRNLGALLTRYRKVLVPELNGGQLVQLLRARFLVDGISFPKLRGRPFTIAEIETKIEEVLL